MASSSCNLDATFSSLHPDIIETHVLTKFDGLSLASLASTCNLLHTVCNKQSLWKHICDSTWNSIKNPLVQQTISSFPGAYRFFYNDSFPVLTANSSRGSLLLGQVETSELISAVDIRFGNNPVFSKVTVTDTIGSSSFPGSLFCVNLIDQKETVEIPLEYQGDDYENLCMSTLEDNLTLSWILIDPTLKRAANFSSLRPVRVRSHGNNKSGIEVTYSTILSGDCCGIDTTEFVECRVVAIFGCEKGSNMELRELSMCLVDMVRSRLNGEMSLRVLQNALVNGERRKENGRGKELYAQNLDCKRQRLVFWVFLVISVISLLRFA